MRLIRISTFLAVLLGLGACSDRHPIRVATAPRIGAVAEWMAAVKVVQTPGVDPMTSEPGRNIAVSYSEALVMARYGAVRQDLVRGKVFTEIASDVINLGLAGAIPIVNGERAKTILGALAVGFLGVHHSVDKNIFQQQTSAALLSAMDSCVIKERAVISAHRRMDMVLYPLYDAYPDLVMLYGCTTLPGAIQELTETQAAASHQTRLDRVSTETLASFESLASAFAAAAKTNKPLAVRFLKQLNVNVSDSPAEEQLIEGYRSLLTAAATTEYRKTILDAANKSGLRNEQK